MNARTCYRWGPCLLVASLAIGCTPLHEFRAPDSDLPSESTRTPLSLGLRGDSVFNANKTSNLFTTISASTGWHRSLEAMGGGTIIAASGQAKEQPPAPHEARGQAPAPLPQPRSTPAAANNDQLTTIPPASVPPNLPNKFDPHIRTNPTVTGARLQLAPYEVPTDRVIDLTQQMDMLAGQNHSLLLRIKELETQALGREQSLKEAERELEALASAAVKERATLQSQIDLLHGKIKQLEEEDIRMLELMIEALKKLLERVP